MRRSRKKISVSQLPAMPWRDVCLLAMAMLAAPWLFSSPQSLGLLTQVGIAMVACLSYRLLLGEGGLLSFGHAIHSGLGAYAAMYTLKAVAAGNLFIPVGLLPLAGGVAGMASALLTGWVATRHGGTAFAMITLGMGELVYALALMLPELSGGEGGLTGNRVVGPTVLGIRWDTPLQLYGLVGFYALTSFVLLAAYMRSPLGFLLNASRENSQRLEFLGYSVWQIRLKAHGAAGFIAGIAGGLAALYFEIVTAEVLSSSRSGAFLMFAYLGGIGHMWGAVIGALLWVMTTVVLSTWTQAWLLYLGLCFLLAVGWMPEGCIGLIGTVRRLFAGAHLNKLCPVVLALGATGTTLALGSFALIEMLYQQHYASAMGRSLNFMGVQLDTASPACWFGTVFVAITGGGLFELTRRHVLREFGLFEVEVAT